MTTTNLPGFGDMCLCGSYGPCRCPPEPDPQILFDEAYDRGYDACQADGPDNHPLACWPENDVDAAVARDWRRLVSGGSIVGVGGRRFYGSNWFNVPRAWQLRGLYGIDPFRREPCPEGYLAGFEDAMAGLPSAVADPAAHAYWAEALDAYEPWPDAPDGPLGLWTPAADVDDGLPF